MSKYIPAVKVVDHFGATRFELSWHTEPFDTYQEALNKATHEVEIVVKRDPIRRKDSLEYKNKSVKPVVLKEVQMVEAES